MEQFVHSHHSPANWFMPFRMHTTKVSSEPAVEFPVQNSECNFVWFTGCTALTISRNNSLLVSGGCEGQIRFWKIDPIRQSLLTVLKEHTAPIASLHFNCFDREIVSASGDGTCIIWDIAWVTQFRRPDCFWIFSHFIFAGAKCVSKFLSSTPNSLVLNSFRRACKYWRRVVTGGSPIGRYTMRVWCESSTEATKGRSIVCHWITPAKCSPQPATINWSRWEIEFFFGGKW